jgi:hypothetical protein
VVVRFQQVDRRVLVTLALIFGSQSLIAQSGRASITGVVSDTSGAIVEGVSVTATSTTTGVSTQARTNDAGAYSLLQLPAGLTPSGQKRTVSVRK